MLKILDRSITLQLLIFYGLFLLPLLLGGIELYLFQRDALQQHAQRTDLGIAQAIALEVESNVRAAVEDDVELARSQAASHLDLSQLATAFATARLSHPDISLYFVCDPSGHMLLSYPSMPVTIRQPGSFCEYPLEALHSDTPLISAGRVSPTTQTNVVSIVTRMINAQGHMLGMLGMNVSLAQYTAHLLEVQRQLSANGEVRIWIVDDEGQPLADTEHVPLQNDLRKSLPGLNNALRGEQGNLIARAQNREWLYSYLPIAGTHWAVIVQRPTDVTFATIISFQNSLLIALVTLIVGATFFWFALHGWVVAPLVKLAQAVMMIKLEMSQLEAGTLKLAPSFYRLDTLVEQVVSVEERGRMRVKLPEDVPLQGVLLERPDGQIIYANHSFTQFVGLSPQEILPDSFNERLVQEKLLALIEDSDAYHEAIRRAETAHDPQVVEFQVRGCYNQVGQLVPVRRDIRMRLFEVRDQAGQLIGRGKIFRDVTRQNEAEQVKKNLLAIVSHELRTPLTAIKGYATSLLETDVELDDALQEHFLRRIVEEGDRMADLVTSLLEMSQLEAGTLKLAPSFYRLDTLVEQVVSVEERGRMRVKLPEDVPLHAIIEIAARYEPGMADGGLYLSVADNGPGLPPHLTERIFDRFYQVDAGRQRSSSGVGLGLAICRGFIEAHGGRIWAENRTNGVTGAIFHIWLPPKLLLSPDTPGTQPNRFDLHNAL